MNDLTTVLSLLAIAAILMHIYMPPFQFAYACAEGCDLKDPEKEERPAWHDHVMFKKDAAPAPDPDPAIGEAAKINAQLGVDFLDFSKEQFNVSTARQKEQDKIAKQIADQQMAASKQSQEWATADRDRYETVFQPLQDEFIDTAKNWDSAERQDKLSAEAKADVSNNANLARQANERNMASMGVDPTSGRYAGVARAGELATGLASAGAENNARNQVRKEGVAMRADAVNMGNGLAVNPATSLGLSSSTGSAAYGTTAGNNAQASGLGGIVGQGYQGAMNGYNSQANILNQQYGNQLQAWQAQTQADAQSSSGLWGGLGSAAGMGLMAF